jgi:adenylate kinase family enzyme
MQRILIIGCPGAGKTTLANKIAARSGLPLTHLDKLYHDNRFNYAEDALAWRNRVQKLVDEPAWIIDGNYKSTFDIRMPRADTIIYLDYPTWITVARAYKRRIHFRKTLRPDMPPNWKESLDATFLRFILNYRRRLRPQVLALLRHYAPDRQIYICRSPKEAGDLLRSLA